MEQKRPHIPNAIDLFHLDVFLQEQKDKLLEGRGIKESTDKNYFNTDLFFKEVANLAKFDESQGPDLINQVADLLEKVVPQMMNAFEYRGDDYHKTDFYRNWIHFLAFRNVSSSRLIETITDHGGMQMYHARSRSQFEPAFLLYQSSLEKLNKIPHIPEAKCQEVSQFINSYGVKTISSYLSLTTDALNKNIDYEKIQLSTEYNFPSYAEGAIETYKQTLQLMAKVSSKEELRDFSEKGHAALLDNISTIERGSFYIDANGEHYEHTFPDYKNRVNFMQISLKTLRHSDSMDMEKFFVDVINNVPKLLEDLIEHNEAALCFDFYQNILMLNHPNKELQAGFAGTYGGKCAAELARNHPNETADFLLSLRDTFNINKGDVLILTDPKSSKDAPQPIAVLVNQNTVVHSLAERDVVFFKDRTHETFVRDASVKDEKFKSSVWFTDFSTKAIIKMVSPVHNTNYFEPLENPHVKHYGRHIHSCPSFAYRYKM